MYFKNAAVTNFRRSVTKTFMVPLTSLKPQNDYKFVREVIKFFVQSLCQ